MVRYFDLLKELCQCFLTKDLVMRAQPKGVWGRREVSEQHREFISKLLDLELKTSVNRDYTKYYILTPEATMSKCCEWHNENSGENISFNIVRDGISYDKNKVLNVIPLENFNKLFYANSDLSKEIELLDKLIIKYGDKRELDLGTPLDMSCNREVKELTDEEFEDLVKVLTRYSYKHIEEISKSIKEKYKGYFNYLNNSLELNEAEKERVKRLAGLLDVKVNLKRPDIRKEIQPKEKKVPNLAI